MVGSRQVLVDVVVDAEDGDVDFLEGQRIPGGGVVFDVVEHPICNLPNLFLFPLPPVELILNSRQNLTHDTLRSTEEVKKTMKLPPEIDDDLDRRGGGSSGRREKMMMIRSKYRDCDN